MSRKYWILGIVPVLLSVMILAVPLTDASVTQVTTYDYTCIDEFGIAVDMTEGQVISDTDGDTFLHVRPVVTSNSTGIQFSWETKTDYRPYGPLNIAVKSYNGTVSDLESTFNQRGQSIYVDTHTNLNRWGYWGNGGGLNYQYSDIVTYAVYITDRTDSSSSDYGRVDPYYPTVLYFQFNLSENITWKFQSSITYDYNDGITSNRTVDVIHSYSDDSARDLIVELLPDPAQQNHTFAGWEVSIGIATINDDGTVTLNEGTDITLRATWQLETWTVTYYGDQEKSSIAYIQEIPRGSPIGNTVNTVAAYLDIEEGYTLLAWYRDSVSTANRVDNPTTYVPTADIGMIPMIKANIEFTDRPISRVVSATQLGIFVGEGLEGSYYAFSIDNGQKDYTTLEWTISGIELDQITRSSENFIWYLEPGTYDVSVTLSNPLGDTVCGLQHTLTVDVNNTDSTDRTSLMALPIMIALFAAVIIFIFIARRYI